MGAFPVAPLATLISAASDCCRRRSSCLEPRAADYGGASPGHCDDTTRSFPVVRQVTPPAAHHCYKPPAACADCNKLELVALQDPANQFYGAVWHRSGQWRRHDFVTGGRSEVWVYRGSRVRSPPVPVVLSVYQRSCAKLLWTVVVTVIRHELL